jgi:RNA polymerase sigma-70 factor, ECF subfamily
VQALRAGDEATFRALVDLHSPALLRVAMAYVPSREIAEEAVQETWIALMRGIGRFEGRSSLKSWLFRILTNVALKGGGRERRSVPCALLRLRASRRGPPARADTAPRDRCGTIPGVLIGSSGRFLRSCSPVAMT